jgi:hypothetical protein
MDGNEWTASHSIASPECAKTVEQIQSDVSNGHVAFAEHDLCIVPKSHYARPWEVCRYGITQIEMASAWVNLGTP